MKAIRLVLAAMLLAVAAGGAYASDHSTVRASDCCDGGKAVQGKK